MEFWRPEGRGHRSHLGIKQGLSLGHQPAKRLCVTFSHELDSTFYDIQVLFTQRLMLSPFCVGIRKGISLVQVGEDLDRILFCTQVGKHPIQMLLHIQGAHFDLITVESHQIGFYTKSTSLIQTSAAATGTEFAHIGDIHLAQRVEIEII